MGPARKRSHLAVFALLGVSNGHEVAGKGATDVCAIDPQSIVSDACASFSTLDSLNNALQPSITALTHTTDFFSYYRLNLYNKVCPFWDDENSLCGNIACAVNTIENEEDIPPIWRAEELGKLEGPKAQHPDRKLQAERQTKPLQGELGEDVGESCVLEYDDECDERDYCVPEDESATAKGDYVSLVDNPERFTGYSGPGAHQVWEAIYRENCFSTGRDEVSYTGGTSALSSPFGKEAARGLKSVMQEHGRHQVLSGATQGLKGMADETPEVDDECLEKRVFYRVISGMHASISAHLCWDYLNQTTGEWGPNLQCYKERLHDHPERVSNLYFNYALVLRAVAKVRNALKEYTFCSGDPSQDRLTKSMTLSLANQIAAGPIIYDESLMFQDHSVEGLKEDFKNRFRNVSRTMDCVGCDKCRLWGKLQTAGYGTALKILFEFDEHDPGHNPPLRRTELVALMNTLDKISHALKAVAKFHTLLEPARARESTAPKIVPNADPIVDELVGHEREIRHPSISEQFREECANIWHVTKFILKSYRDAPGNLLKIVFMNIQMLWDWWLGLPQRRIVYEFRKPPPREEL